MYNSTKDDAMEISVLADATGLTDLEVIVTKPDGTDEVSNVSLTEIGGKKIYKGNYTPTEVGMYYFEIVSPTETGLAGMRARMKVVEFDNADLDTKLDTINTAVGNNADAISTVDGKITDMDAGYQHGFLN